MTGCAPRSTWHGRPRTARRRHGRRKPSDELHKYQKFSFWPRFLTAVMSAPVAPPAASPAGTRMSEITGPQRPGVLAAVRELTDAVYPGLDVTARSSRC